FSSLAGGGTIGQGDNYPVNAFIETQEGTLTTSTSQWKHYTWILDYERQSLYWRNSGEEPEKDELLLFMEIPEDGDINQINSAHGSFATLSPPNYNWFDEINAVRFYWRGVDNFALSNVSISKTGEPVTTYIQFAKNRLKVQESEGSAELILLIANQEKDEATKAEITLIKGNSNLIDGFEKASVVFPANESSPQTLSLTLTGDDNAENDTLIFKISDIQGGYLPTIGQIDSLMLVIDDRIGTKIIDNIFSEVKIFPNPATNRLLIEGMEEIDDDYRYIIFDITGKQRIDGKANGNIILNVEELENGIYFIRFYQNSSIITKRVSILK
ncbi:MAG: T9SS type A sorting domain-containing protein, partial [Bacteroidales bacterium]